MRPPDRARGSPDDEFDPSRKPSDPALRREWYAERGRRNQKAAAAITAAIVLVGVVGFRLIRRTHRAEIDEERDRLAPAVARLQEWQRGDRGRVDDVRPVYEVVLARAAIDDPARADRLSVRFASEERFLGWTTGPTPATGDAGANEWRHSLEAVLADVVASAPEGEPKVWIHVEAGLHDAHPKEVQAVVGGLVDRFGGERVLVRTLRPDHDPEPASKGGSGRR